MADLVRILSAASRAGGPIKGVITSVDTTTGRVSVMANGAVITATATDQTLASASVGVGALLIPVGQTFVLVATMGGSIVSPNLIPNGKFSNPGDGLAPSGWSVSQVQPQSFQFYANATAGPAGGFAGVVTIASMGGYNAISVISSPDFSIDGGATYTLSFDATCDATVTNSIAWPSLLCSSSSGGYGTDVSNGILSPNVGATWGTPYTTVLTIPDGLDRAHLNLGIFCDTTSTGNIYLANVSLRKTA